MSLVEMLAGPSGRLLTQVLAHFLWQGLVVAGVLTLIVDLGGLRRAAARYACSLTALVAMTACPLVTLIWLTVNQDAATAASHMPDSANEAPAQIALLGPL